MLIMPPLWRRLPTHCGPLRNRARFEWRYCVLKAPAQALIAALRRHVASSADTVYAIARTLWYLAMNNCLHATLGPLTSEHAAALRSAMAAHPTHPDLQLCCDGVLALLH